MKALMTNGIIERKPRIPSDWVRPNGTTVLGYITKTEYHFEDGWRDFVEPTFDPFNFKRTNVLIEVDNIVTYEVVEMTQQEKDDYQQAQIPSILTASQLRQALILQGISIESVVNAINTLPSPQKEIMLVRWEYETEYMRTSEEVVGIATILGLTAEDLKQIYITGIDL